MHVRESQIETLCQLQVVCTRIVCEVNVLGVWTETGHFSMQLCEKTARICQICAAPLFARAF
jgi:hypothetical protein